MNVRAGLQRRLSAEELMLSNCGVGEDSWESLGQQGDQTSLILKEINPEYSVERLMLKLHYFGHLKRRADSLEASDAGKDWRQEKETTVDEMVGWHHWLNGHEFEQALGVGEGQGSLVCCSPWGHRVQTWPTDWTTTLIKCHFNNTASEFDRVNTWPCS